MLILRSGTSAAVVGPSVPAHSVNLWLRLPSVILMRCQTSLMQLFKTSRRASRRCVHRRRRHRCPRVVFALCKSSFTADSCCFYFMPVLVVLLSIVSNIPACLFPFNILCFEMSKRGLRHGNTGIDRWNKTWEKYKCKRKKNRIKSSALSFSFLNRHIFFKAVNSTVLQEILCKQTKEELLKALHRQQQAPSCCRCCLNREENY